MAVSGKDFNEHNICLMKNLTTLKTLFLPNQDYEFEEDDVTADLADL